MPVSLQESKPPAPLRSVAAQCDLHAEVGVSFRQLALTRNVVILIWYRKSINISLFFTLSSSAADIHRAVHCFESQKHQLYAGAEITWNAR